jgi:DNA-binding transcriptional ArsR family regulator
MSRVTMTARPPGIRVPPMPSHRSPAYAAAAGPSVRRRTPVLDLQAGAADAAALLKALSHPDRLLLLCQLVDAECSVADLGLRTGLAQPSLSQQLAVLRGERLVATRRDGRHVVYRIASPSALAVLRTLHALFCPADVAAAPNPKFPDTP